MCWSGTLSRQVVIEMLSDDVLLYIFHHYLDASPKIWHTLTHVCQKWRRIVLTSPLGLHLRLYCTYGTPVLKALEYWPPFPLVVNYGGSPMLDRPSPEDEENIMAALEQSDRVSSITLAVTNSLLEKISAIKKPFSGLEELVLLSQDKAQLTLPSVFWWGHRLRILHSTGVALPSLPQLLLPSQNLVDLQLGEIPGVGYVSPEAFANALCGMTQLQALSLHFLSLPPRRNYVSLDRVVLPALTRFKYRGTSKYLDILVARIDASRLGDIDITFYSQPTFHALQLGLFVSRIELWRPPSRADILSSPGAISITLTQPEALSTRLELQVSCEQLDWKLFSISQICDHFSSFLFSVENLGIRTAGPSTVPDGMDEEQWLRVIRAFGGAKDLRVASELATDISRALRLADEGHKIVLPSLQNLHVLQPVSIGGPLWDSVESFVLQRQLSSLPIQIYVQQDSGEESIPMAVWRKREELAIVSKFIDESPESAEAAYDALGEILHTYPSAPDIDDAAMASSFHFGDLPPTSPHSLGNDVFGEFIDTSDQDHPHSGHTGSSPQIPNVKTEDTTYELLRLGVWKEISGGDAMFHQTSGWKWEGHTHTPDQPWELISTSDKAS
jgi:hypothetical protein